jgi:predicted ArsR family transcriptional regulator
MKSPPQPSALDLLPAARRALLAELKAARRATIVQLAGALSITTEAVRQLLSQLYRDGWIISDCAPEETDDDEIRSPGRPPAEYCLSAAAEDLFPKQYGELAVTLFDELDNVDEVLTSITDRRVEKVDSVVPAAPIEKRIRGLRSIYRDDDPYTDVQKSDRGYLLIEHNCPYLQFATERPLFCSTTVSALRRLTGREVVREERFQDRDGQCVFHIYVDSPVSAARKTRRFEREPEKDFVPLIK